MLTFTLTLGILAAGSILLLGLRSPQHTQRPSVDAVTESRDYDIIQARHTRPNVPAPGVRVARLPRQ